MILIVADLRRLRNEVLFVLLGPLTLLTLMDLHDSAEHRDQIVKII